MKAPQPRKNSLIGQVHNRAKEGQGHGGIWNHRVRIMMWMLCRIKNQISVSRHKRWHELVYGRLYMGHIYCPYSAETGPSVHVHQWSMYTNTTLHTIESIYNFYQSQWADMRKVHMRTNVQWKLQFCSPICVLVSIIWKQHQCSSD